MASIKKIGEIIASIKAIYTYYAKDSDVEVLVKTWSMLLKDAPDDMVSVAAIKCLQICKNPPTPADVLEQMREMISANEPTAEELWVTLTEAVRKAQNYMCDFNYTFVEKNGKTQGENAREKFRQVWEKLPKRLKDYLGGASELLRLARFNEDEMYYEKRQFLKSLPSICKREEYQSLGMLVGGAEGFLPI